VVDVSRRRPPARTRRRADVRLVRPPPPATSGTPSPARIWGGHLPSSSPAGPALDAAGVGIDDVGLIDLYSCFPSAVQIAAASLGLSLDEPGRLTVTGGLPDFGGPGNNYTTHAIACLMIACARPLTGRSGSSQPWAGT